MMIEWLAVWGVTQAVGFVFKPVLEELAKDTVKSWVGDYLKQSLKNVMKLPQKEPLEIAVGKGITEFLKLVQQELEELGCKEQDVQRYVEPFAQFLKYERIRATLGAAFQEECTQLDTEYLSTTWNELSVPSLPEEFDWELVAKRYLRKVKAIRRESEELRKILDSQALETTAEGIKELAGIVPEFDLRAYQESLREAYGYLKLESLDTDGCAYNRLQLWKMFVPQHVRECREYLPKVYELPKEVQKRLQAEGQLEEISDEDLERYRDMYREQPVRPVLEAFNDSKWKYSVILGDPGSGKSTLLQYLALDWAQKPLKELPQHPLPLLIELRKYTRAHHAGQQKTFLEYIHSGSGMICHLNQHDLHDRLQQGKAVVMFDGLDEVFDPGLREDVITGIIRFTNKYPNVRVLVTSRIIGYTSQRFRDAEFRHLMLQDLENEQIKDFIQRWHQMVYTDKTDRKHKQERLKKAIKTKAIRQLAGNPLLLTMMAILNRHQELPRDRSSLYEQSSRVLLHQWDVEQKLLKHPELSSISIDYRDKQAMLREIAWHMQANEQCLSGNMIHAKELEDILLSYLKRIEVDKPRKAARLMIDQLRTRNFILCSLGGDYYAFVHRTFLEYFCAWEFVERFGRRGYEHGLTLEELKDNVFGRHWQDNKFWHEILRLITGMLGKLEPEFAKDIIEYLIKQDGENGNFYNIFLAADCLSEIRNRREIKDCDDILLEKLKCLSEYGIYPRPVGREEMPEFVRIFYIRTNSISSIAKNWKDRIDILNWLKVSAMANEDVNVLCATVRELSRGWYYDPDTHNFLKTCIEPDKDEIVRQIAIQELAWGWHDASDTLSILRSLAQGDDFAGVRLTAINELAQGWLIRPDTRSLFHFCAKKDEDGEIRLVAMQGLAHGWYENPETFPLIYSLAQTDKYWKLRKIAIQELMDKWHDKAGMVDFLCDRAEKDPFEREYEEQDNPRRAALAALVQYYPDHPRTLPLLRNRAEYDPDERVRKYATEALKQLEQSHTDATD